MAQKRVPRVGIPACVKQVDGVPYHSVGDKYIAAVRGLSSALPLVIPSLAEPLPVGEVLDAVDGLLFTGSPSNVGPGAYGGPPARTGTLLDPLRDATTLPLLTEALRRGVPVLAICRGFQELNVACGGTLHQHLSEVPGRLAHNPPGDLPMEVRYGPAHDVSVSPGGLLEKLTGAAAFAVNSLHDQGIDRLGQGLAVEAVAPDGTIEAVSGPGPGFCLGLQWHPEWRAAQSPVSAALFRGFGAALAARV